MSTAKAFEWIDNRRGEQIEQFVHNTTRKDPFLMREVLKIGLGDLGSWTDTDYVVGAKCGCLVGTCAIAASRLGRVDALQVQSERAESIGVFWGSEQVGLVPTTLASAIARGNPRVAKHIEDVGLSVGDECFSEAADDYAAREKDVREYLEDLIATDLRLLGLSAPRPQGRA